MPVLDKVVPDSIPYHLIRWYMHVTLLHQSETGIILVITKSLFVQSEHLLKQVIMKITLCSTFFYNSVTRYKICFPLFEIIILNITSSGDYFALSNHLHR